MEERRVSEGPDAEKICYCMAVTRGDLHKAIAEGNRDIRSLIAATRACLGCGTCRFEVEQFLDEVVPTEEQTPAKD